MEGGLVLMLFSIIVFLATVVESLAAKGGW
jgi:hypothetical protein